MSHDVTFRWVDTDPQHPAQDVLVRLIALTDHAHDDGDLSPYLLDRRHDGTWERTIPLPSDLRTSYQLCPVRDRALRGDNPDDDRWLEVLATGVPDRRARAELPPGNTWGNPGVASILELPDALPQPWTARRSGVDQGMLERIEVGSSVISRWTPPGQHGPLPVVVSFDGTALLRIGIEATFANLVADGVVPPFAAVLVESIHGSAERGPTRIRSLTHPPEFAAFVLDELLPYFGEPREVVLAGQSLGGLAAAHLAATAPDRIGWVIGQSTALWWPGDDDGGLSGAAVIDAYRRPSDVRLFLEAGSEERELLASNHTFRDVLVEHGFDMRFREYRGGHDYACWRGGLADGIVAALAR